MQKFETKEIHTEQFIRWGESHWWMLGRYKIIPNFVIRETKKIKKNGRGKLKLLDLGAGTGEMMKRLNTLFDVRGIDIDKTVLRAARKNKLNIIEGDAVKLPFADKSFDVICAFDLLEHFKEDMDALTHWRSKLKDKGLLFLTVPAYQWLWSVDDIIAHHYRRYTQSDLVRKLNKCGYIVRKSTYFNFWLFPLVLLVKIWKRHSLDIENINNEELFKNFSFHYGQKKFINNILRLIFSSEDFLIKHIRLPVGVSLLVCAEKI